MYIKIAKRIAGWTLVEMMIAVGIFSIAAAAASTAYLFSVRSFQSLSNYSSLDNQNRQTMNRMTRELREAYSIKEFVNGTDSSWVTFVDGNSRKDVQYLFKHNIQQLVRISNGVPTGVLLSHCDLVKFHLGTRAIDTNNLSQVYQETTQVDHGKIIDMSWKTYRITGKNITNSENIQTAKIVLRKQALEQ